jgi:O-antigen/teichoic acid export membrane protein
MPSLKSNLIWNTVSSVTLLASGFCLSVVAARILGPNALGEYQMILLAVAFLPQLITLGYDKYFASKELNDDKIEFFVIKIILLCLFEVVVGSLLLIWFVPFSSERSWEFKTFIVLMICGLTACMNLTKSYFVFSGDGVSWYKLNSKFTLGSSIVKVFALVFVKTYLVLLVVDFTRSLFEVLVNCKKIKYNYCLASIKPSQNFKIFFFKTYKKSICLMLAGLAIATYTKVDLLMLELIEGSKSVGIYSVAANTALIFNGIVSAWSLDWIPWLEDRSKCVKLKKLCLSFGLLSSVIMIASPNIIGMIYGSQYIDSGAIFRILGVGQMGFMACTLSSRYAEQKGFARLQLQRTAFGAIINIILNIIMIPNLSYYGAAMATVAAYYATFLVTPFLPDGYSIYKKTLSPEIVTKN